MLPKSLDVFTVLSVWLSSQFAEMCALGHKLALMTVSGAISPVNFSDSSNSPLFSDLFVVIQVLQVKRFLR